jgi:hypothetical protein
MFSPWANEKVEQLAANNLTIPQDAIASLLQRLVLPAFADGFPGDYMHGDIGFSQNGSHAVETTFANPSECYLLSIEV